MYINLLYYFLIQPILILIVGLMILGIHLFTITMITQLLVITNHLCFINIGPIISQFLPTTFQTSILVLDDYSILDETNIAFADFELKVKSLDYYEEHYEDKIN